MNTVIEQYGKKVNYLWLTYKWSQQKNIPKILKTFCTLRSLTLFLHNSSKEPPRPLFLAQLGNTSGSGTTIPIRKA